MVGIVAVMLDDCDRSCVVVDLSKGKIIKTFKGVDGVDKGGDLS
jgi:hypothetical protein